MIDAPKRIALACGLSLIVLSQHAPGDDNRFLTVPLGQYMDGEYASDLAFKPADGQAEAKGQITVSGVPFEIARAEDGSWKSVDVGPSRWREMEQDPLEFYGKWCKASAKDGDLVLHLSKDLYYRAHVLAVADGLEGRDPVLSLRSGAFQSRAFLTDTTVDIPTMNNRAGGSALDSLAGTFSRGEADKSGRLFVIPVDIHVGDLLQLLAGEHRINTFDVQLTGRLHVRVSAPDPANFGVLPVGAPSGARVFGITFERSPVALAVDGLSTLNVFPEARQPVFDLTVENTSTEERDIELIAAWHRDGRGVQTPPDKQSWRVTLAAGEKRTLKNELKCDEFGKYDYTVSLIDEALGRLITRTTTLARLPKFTTAPLEEGLKSRFCVWCWNSAHLSLGDAIAVDPLDWLGVGHVFTFSDEGMEFNLTDKGMDRLQRNGMHRFRTKVEHCFHELFVPWTMEYPAFMLQEGRHQLTEKKEKWFQEQWDYAIKHCTKIRNEKPDAKIVFGNSTINSVEEFLYRGFPAELFNALGHEACGLMRMSERQPELATLQEVFWFKRALEEYGYEKPLWAWFEWQYHSTNAGNVSRQEQADMYVRDMLHGLSYNLERICPAAVEDVGNGYYFSNWGAAGLFTRAPDVHPKLSYVAYAVAAHLLSDADFVRAVPTGSHSTYCLEFDRRRGDKMFACWTLRGSREVSLSGVFDGEVRVVDQQGNARTLDPQGGTVTFETAPSPVFVEGVRKCEQTALSRPDHRSPQGIKTRPLTVLDLLDKWRIIAEPSEVLDNGNFDMPRQKGTFEVSLVDDEARGKCLQFALKQRGHRPPWIPSYQAIELEQPVEIPNEPTALGLWVRGNSGWGRIDLELRDAKGERWLSVGQPMAWNANDEMSVSYIIFDDWRWMQIRLPGHYDSGYHWPPYCNWRNGTPDETGDGIVDYPLSLTGLIVEQREQIVYVNQMVDTSREPIRVSGLTAVYGDPEEVGDWAERAADAD